MTHPSITDEMVERAARAHGERLAQEVERLRSLATTKGALGILEHQLGKIVKLRARIAELEAEREEMEAATRKNFLAERDAIKAKTIQECALLADMFMEAHDAEGPTSLTHTAMLVRARQAQTAQDIAKAIRALNQPESSSSSGKSE